MATVALTDDNFDSATRGRVALIDFWAAWRSPCHVFAPVFESASQRHPDVLFGKVDVDRNPRLAERFLVRSIPTLLAMRDGEVLLARVGAMSLAALDEVVRLSSTAATDAQAQSS